MRTHSIAMMRAGSAPKRRLPTEGSRIRFIYDTLYEYRGLQMSKEDHAALVDLVGGSGPYNAARTCLIDIWGCDIRGRSLIGEWCGRVYVDYAAERVAA